MYDPTFERQLAVENEKLEKDVKYWKDKYIKAERKASYYESMFDTYDNICEEKTELIVMLLEQVKLELLQKTQELERYKEAEKEGRLVELPCKVGETIYTIEDISYPCEECSMCPEELKDLCYTKHTDYDLWSGESDYNCPTVYKIQEHICEGFEIGENGISLPGEWGYEGLETFRSIDGKCYYDRATAEAALEGGSKK